MKTTTIVLGEKSYTISPLTIGQLEDLDTAVMIQDVDDPQENTRRAFKRMVSAIAVAVRRTNPEVTEDAIRDSTATRDQLFEAYRAVLEHSGMKLTRKDASPGEAEAPKTGA